MKLYDYFRSSAAFRMRIALNLKGLTAEREFIHLRRKDQSSDAYLGVNPQGLVPALVDDDGTVLTQSMAMIEYLDETRPDGPRLLPDDARARARVRAISQAIACEIHPLNNLRVLRHLGSEFDIGEGGPKRALVQILDHRRDDRSGGTVVCRGEQAICTRRHTDHGRYLPRAAGL